MSAHDNNHNSEHDERGPSTRPAGSTERPARGELFSNESARALWAAVLTLPEGLRQEFELRLRAHVAVPDTRQSPHAARIARAVTALREAAGMLDAEGVEGGLTVDAYRQLRAEHPEFGWPPDGSIRRWLGGNWNDALRRARLDAVPDGDALVVELGAKFSWDELARAIRACVDDLRDPNQPDVDPDPGLHSYIGWAKRPDVRRRPGRRPLSQNTFDRFGGWLACKQAVLAGAGPPLGPTSSSTRSATHRPSSGYGYTDEELHAAIREVAERLGRVPRASEFRPQREAILAAEKADGKPPRPFPSYVKIVARYGCWDAALQAAGLQPFATPRVCAVSGRAERQEPRNHIPTEDILAGIREAHEAKGAPFTVGAYRSYCEERDGISKQGRRLATYPCIYQRFGAWKKACRAAGVTQ